MLLNNRSEKGRCTYSQVGQGSFIVASTSNKTQEESKKRFINETISTSGPFSAVIGALAGTKETVMI
jgi:hypothetical protein